MLITSFHKADSVQFGMKEMIKKRESIHQAPLQQQDKLTLQKEKPLEQILTETQHLLEQAKEKPFPFRKLTAANVALEKLKKQVQLSNQEAAMKARQLQHIEHMQKQTLQAQRALEMAQSSAPSAEQKESDAVLERYFEDLVSSDVNTAELAKQFLISLGASEEKVTQLEALLLQEKKKGKGPVKFGGRDDSDLYSFIGSFNEPYGPTPDNLANWLKNQIKSEIQAQSAPSVIVNSSVDYTLQEIQQQLDPVMFGASRRIIGPDGHVKWIDLSEPLPAGCQELS